MARKLQLIGHVCRADYNTHRSPIKFPYFTTGAVFFCLWLPIKEEYSLSGHLKDKSIRYIFSATRKLIVETSFHFFLLQVSEKKMPAWLNNKKSEFMKIFFGKITFGFNTWARMEILKLMIDFTVINC